MTFEQFLELDVPEGTSPRTGLKLCWDTAYSEGYSKAIQDYIKSQNMAQFYDREKQL